jgi:hypothetical protein
LYAEVARHLEPDKLFVHHVKIAKALTSLVEFGETPCHGIEPGTLASQQLDAG